ncbi:YsnF/AvaK domain-containing protein [Aerosakkonemataceae cyanobacterium BLCC-F50]|uniref:YsnF/AvaK domain-containing protein n=1 Tax=Floridaenema flaviceps BLCC-F50 TaxID=3153642 RepID=A0ABV4XLK7_9CYAN
MDNQTGAKKPESVTHNLRVKALLAKLKNKLHNFRVLDKKGLSIGIIKDIYLSNTRQINLLILATDLPQSYTFSLTSNQIQQVDYPNQAILTSIDKSEIQPILASPELPTTEEQVNKTSLPDSYVNDPEISDSSSTDVVEEEVIRLIEERLVINHQKRKVGEVVVRKEIETRMVEVPVQYEKLIVEQVSPEPKIIAEVDLGQHRDVATTNNDIALNQTSTNNTVKGEFVSPKTASLLLDAIAKQKHHDCQLVRVEIVLVSSENQKTYQEWFDRCSGT